MVQAQTLKNKFWYDESGQAIPYNRITKVERLMEKQSARLAKRAQKLNETLADFKTEVNAVCREAYDAFMSEKGVDLKKRKGNFTWYNFNRSIKIEVNINERIDFDDLTARAAKGKFMAFLEANIESDDQFIKQMVLDAFETSKGKLDARKIFALMRYRIKINDPLFQDAVRLLEESIRRPESRTYFRVWTKDTTGKYNHIDLNFSSL